MNELELEFTKMVREHRKTIYTVCYFFSDNPTYVVDGITHYVVDHTPSLFWKTATETLSAEFVKYADLLIEGRPLENDVLRGCHNFECGTILDQRIIDFQGRDLNSGQ